MSGRRLNTRTSLDVTHRLVNIQASILGHAMCCNAKNQFSNQRLRTANILTEVLNMKNRMQSHIRNLWIICILVMYEDRVCRGYWFCIGQIRYVTCSPGRRMIDKVDFQLQVDLHLHRLFRISLLCIGCG